MKLADVLLDLGSVPGDLCVVARRPWSATSDVLLVRLDEDFRVPGIALEAGYEYFLEVDVIRKEVLGPWRSRLDMSQTLDVVLYYAEHDAWPTWFNEQCQRNA